MFSFSPHSGARAAQLVKTKEESRRMTCSLAGGGGGDGGGGRPSCPESMESEETQLSLRYFMSCAVFGFGDL